LYEFKGGHIGVFVGSRSQKELAPTIADWLVKRDVMVGKNKSQATKSEATKPASKVTESLATATAKAELKPVLKPAVVKTNSKKQAKKK